MTNNILILHHNDRDGYISAACIASAYNFNKYNIKYIDIDYSFKLKDLKINFNQYKYIYLLDYNIENDENAKFMIELSENNNLNLVWIDHHNGSIEYSKKYKKLNKISGYRIIGLSGAALSWIYLKNHLSDSDKKSGLNNILLYKDKFTDKFFARKYLILNKCPEIILYTHRYDIWDLDIEDDKRPLYFNYGYPCPKSPDDAIDYIKMPIAFKLDHILIRGEKLYDKIIDENLELLSKLGFEFILNYNNHEYKCISINRPFGNSLMFGDLIKNENYDIGCVWYYNGKTGKYIYSLYSKDEIDVSKICKSFGGGGHYHAAGFSSDNPIFSKNNKYTIVK